MKPRIKSISILIFLLATIGIQIHPELTKDSPLPPLTSPLTGFPGKILYDSVETFLAGQSTFELNLTFQKDYIYYFHLETFNPFSEEVQVDLYLTSTASRQYHLFEKSAVVDNNQTIMFFEYGSAENGTHEIKYLVYTEANLNLHLYIEEFISFDQYYSKFAKDVQAFSGYDELIVTDIQQFGPNRATMEYTVPVSDDTGYTFNFLAVSPVCPSDTTLLLPSERPSVTMQIELAGIEFNFYPAVPIEKYTLYSNLGDPFIEDRTLENDTFLIRFGAQCDGNLTVQFEFTSFWPFDANFAFIVYSTGEIGNGPDDPPLEDQESEGTNSTDNLNGTEGDDSDLDGEGSFTFEERADHLYFTVTSFLQDHFWGLALGIGALTCMILGIGVYLESAKTKELSTAYDRKLSE